MKTQITAFLKKIPSRIPLPYQDTAKVICGAFLRNLIRGILKIVVAGFLAPRALGILRAIFALFIIMANLVEFGLDQALVTFVATAIGKGDMLEKNRILKAVLFLKIAIVLLFLLIGNLVAQKIAVLILSDAGLTLYVRLAIFAVAGHMLWKYISNYLSAHQQFTKTAFFIITMPVLMLSAALVLIIFERFSLTAAILIYLFAPALTALIWWPFLDRAFLKTRIRDRALFQKLLRFSRWIYISNTASAVRNHAGVLLLKNTHLSGSVAAGETNAGLFSFGSDLANEITVFSESILTVMLPKAAGQKDPRALKRFIKKSYQHLLVLIIPLSLLIFLAKPMILMLSYIKADYLNYLPSYPVFMILYAGGLFSLASIPMTTALYALGLPRIETYLSLFSMLVLLASAVWLIPAYGYNGAAIAVLIQRVASFAGIFIYGLITLNKFDAKPDGRSFS